MRCHGVLKRVRDDNCPLVSVAPTLIDDVEEACFYEFTQQDGSIAGPLKRINDQWWFSVCAPCMGALRGRFATWEEWAPVLLSPQLWWLRRLMDHGLIERPVIGTMHYD